MHIFCCRERRAARRAALEKAEPEADQAGRNDWGRQRADSKNNGNDRARLEVSAPVNERPRSPRSSPRPSPRSSPRTSPTLQRRKFKFEEAKTEGELKSVLS